VEEEEEGSSIRLVVVGRGGRCIIRRAAIDKDDGPSEEGELTHKTVVYRNRM